MSAAGDRESLKALLLRHSVLRGKFVLASGAVSDVYVDCRLTTLARGWQPQAVGGLTMGADPVSCAVAHVSHETGSPVDAFVGERLRRATGESATWRVLRAHGVSRQCR